MDGHHERMIGAAYNGLHPGLVKLKRGSDTKVEQWRIPDRANGGCQTVTHILKSRLHITCSSTLQTSMLAQP